MKNKLSLADQQKLVSKLLKIDINLVKKVSFVFPKTDILMVMITEDYKEIYEGYKGGIRLLVNNNGEVLFCSSAAMSNNELLEAFKNGKRTPIDSF